MGKKLTQQEIITQFKKIHGDLYDYSLVDYKGDSSKIKIICKEHGVFEQQVACHKRQKQGCPKCALERIKKAQLLDNKHFITKMIKIHGETKFIYDKTQYIGAHKNLIITCSKCLKDIKVSPCISYRLKGCKFCSFYTKKSLTNEQFIEKAHKIHNNIYDYSLVEYKNNKTEVKILCLKHGIFSQTPSVHLDGKSGCPHCCKSKGEKVISLILENNNIEYIFQYPVKIENSYHYFDFFLPKEQIIIEFNGKQHYEPIDFFGGIKGFEVLKIRDNIKEKYCTDNNINFIVISYKDNIEEKINLALQIK